MSDYANGVKDFWNRKFDAEGYVYGTMPNAYFKQEVGKYPAGHMLVAGAGEGRDAVYAASQGWQVTCIDLSEEGRRKALELAKRSGVNLEYLIADIADVDYAEESFDMVVSVFCHLPENARLRFYAGAMKWLKEGGIFVMEGFTTKQLNYSSGGPKDVSLLIDAGLVRKELAGLEVLILSEHERVLDEGPLHQGVASLLSYTGRKPVKKHQ